MMPSRGLVLSFLELLLGDGLVTILTFLAFGCISFPLKLYWFLGANWPSPSYSLQGTGKWYELQDLQVTDILPQMITLSEAYIQVGWLHSMSVEVTGCGSWWEKCCGWRQGVGLSWLGCLSTCSGERGGARSELQWREGRESRDELWVSKEVLCVQSARSGLQVCSLISRKKSSESSGVISEALPSSLGKVSTLCDPTALSHVYGAAAACFNCPVHCVGSSRSWGALSSLSSFFKKFLLFGHTVQHMGSYFPNQASNPCPLQWKCSVLTTGPPRKSPCLLFLTVLVSAEKEDWG